MISTQRIVTIIELNTQNIIGVPLLTIIYNEIKQKISELKSSPSFNNDASIHLIIKVTSLGIFIDDRDIEIIKYNLEDKNVLNSWGIGELNFFQIELFLPNISAPLVVIGRQTLEAIRTHFKIKHKNSLSKDI